MKNCRESLVKCNIDLNLADSVSQKTDSYKELFNFAKDLIFDPHFWVDVDYLCSILVPIILIVILRFSDNSYKIPVGFIGLVCYKYYLFTVNIANFAFQNRVHKSDMTNLAN